MNAFIIDIKIVKFCSDLLQWTRYYTAIMKSFHDTSMNAVITIDISFEFLCSTILTVQVVGNSHSFASAMPPLVMAKVASLSGMSGLEEEEQ